MGEKEKTTIIGVIPQYPKHSQNNIYARVRMPPVGIVSVLSQISHFSELDVYAIDENNYSGPKDYNSLPNHRFLQNKTPAKIAMFYGGMSNSIPRLFSLAKQYKKFGAITIAGGSHVDALPEEALNSGVDIIVHGEGEETIKELLEVIMSDGELVEGYKKNLGTIKGISFLNEKNKIIFTGKRDHVIDLDVLIDTDLTLIKFLKKRWSAIPINRGRGCNFNCEFCVVNKQYGKFKASTTKRVFRQIVRYLDMGYKKFFFTDDNFAQNPEEAIELCKMMGDYQKKFGKKIKSITAQVRSEIAENDELIEAMRYGGITGLAIGYESPINEELKAMKKGVTVEKLVRRSRKLSNFFHLHGMFIFGYPSFKDSKHKSNLTFEKRAKAYLKFFKQSKIDSVQVLNAVPLPGSLLREKLETEGRLLPLEVVGWDKYDGQFLCYDPTVEGLDPYVLQNMPRELMKKRYMGNFFARSLNYGNWMTWAYNASAGFLIQFPTFYVKRFFYNLAQKRRANTLNNRKVLLPRRNIFHEPLVSAWKDIRKKWRNLALKTYAASIVKRWTKAYKKSGYLRSMKRIYAKKKFA